jgi:hypothetical protein
MATQWAAELGNVREESATIVGAARSEEGDAALVLARSGGGEGRGEGTGGNATGCSGGGGATHQDSGGEHVPDSG